ncbi:MAG TPA: glycosyltransferase family 9 protein [Ferruginibacter sp.]|nr:glycosyltransferase family 9 protein [Ferruginibacter sp.]
MKLLPVKKRKIAILFTSGLGDTVLFIPLMKELKRKQFNITCIFFAEYDNDCLFDDSLVDKKIFIKTKLFVLFYALSNFKVFTNFYINHLEDGRLLNFSSKLCSKLVTKTYRNKNKNDHHLRIKASIASFSDAEQNLHLLYSRYNSVIKTPSNFYFPNPKLQVDVQNKFFLTTNKKRYIFQISTGNNLTPFKNWPISNWLNVIEKLCNLYTQYECIIIGDRTETGYTSNFEKLNFKNLNILIGKTTVEDAFNLIANSNGYIGLDSGFLHIAVALKKRTLAIFGASNEKLYGYAHLDANNHKEIIADIGCRPCHGWKCANTSRVNNPLLCPDFACLTSITPEFVFNEIVSHFNL